MRVVPGRYSPVREGPGGRLTVELAGDHPGVTDPVYRARRDELAALAASWRPGEPVPQPSYTDTEHGVWAEVSAALDEMHDRYACGSFVEGKSSLELPADRVPQLSEVTSKLEPLSGFRYHPVAGLAPLRDFYGSFAAGVFWSTQYLRHPSVPLYTPEPDVIHEVIGHANQLASGGYADMYRLVGEAVARTQDAQALRFLSHVFWYTMEFGVVYENGSLKAFGAGILSSVGETEAVGRGDGTEVRPVDFLAMGNADYDITRYQPVLYAWSSHAEMQDRLSDFLAGYDDSTPARLLSRAS